MFTFINNTFDLNDPEIIEATKKNNSNANKNTIKIIIKQKPRNVKKKTDFKSKSQLKTRKKEKLYNNRRNFSRQFEK